VGVPLRKQNIGSTTIHDPNEITMILSATLCSREKNVNRFSLFFNRPKCYKITLLNNLDIFIF